MPCASASYSLIFDTGVFTNRTESIAHRQLPHPGRAGEKVYFHGYPAKLKARPKFTPLDCGFRPCPTKSRFAYFDGARM
jgi:hypothetical protein